MNLSHLLKLCGFLAFLWVAFLLLQSTDLGFYLSQDRIINFLEFLGPFAPVVFTLLMAVAVVISPIPSLPLDFAAGVFFGPFLGTLYAVSGAELGQFAVS
ncbi:MAG TPA: hypothetical protein VGB26_11685 [Nitrospiria bacterium]|jgi:uncharacterized membrane protein YdjX (TVP38/TMEM64 family)